MSNAISDWSNYEILVLLEVLDVSILTRATHGLLS